MTELLGDDEIVKEDCPNCGGLAISVKCKLVCNNCHTILENCNGD